MLAHLIPHLIHGLEYSTLSAGVVFSFMTGTQLIGLFLGGYLGDRFDKKWMGDKRNTMKQKTKRYDTY